MSKYRNHREPRSRGFDNDSSQEPELNYFQREPARAPATTGSPPIDVEVLWFNVDKGFGFVKLADGSDVFLHVGALESAGHRKVSEGMHLKVRIAQGQKGPQVAEVLEVSGGTSSDVEPAFRSVRTAIPDSPGGESSGTVKWYNADKGFGFISLEDGSKDAFVHVSALKRCGLDLLEEGQRVVVEVGQGQKGTEVRSVRLA